MSYLVDTNVLLRGVQKSHPMHSEAVNAINLLLRNPETVSVVPQTLVEFWAVATRPQKHNGLELSIDETSQQMAYFKSIFTLLPDTDGIFKEWERLVRAHRVLGKQVYDARLVAAMNVHNLYHLMTFNTADFKRFTNITVVSP
jgi:predicted nucleic acid-binding protein